MPNVNEIYGGEYLKKEHVTRPTTLTIAATGMTTFEDGKKQIVLHFNRTDKVLGLNVTNANFCATAFQSFNSDDWVGKKIEVYVDPNVMMKGSRVGGVRVRLPNGQQPLSDVSGTTQPQGPGAEPAPDFDDDDVPF